MENHPNEPETLWFKSDGAFPNNPELPVLVYRRAIKAESPPLADEMEDRFRENAWSGCWRWGVYDFHHFHSKAHEVLGVANGTAQLQLGGPIGSIVEVEAGDVVVLPAGTGHKNVGASEDFMVVGAYPKGQENYDMRRGDASELDAAVANIRSTPLPETDPVFGRSGPLRELWKPIE